MSDYRESTLGILIKDLYYWNTDSYDLGYRSQFINQDTWLPDWNGMRTEQLAIWIIERREECIENIFDTCELLGVDIMAIVKDREYLDKFIDTSKLSDNDIKLLIKQIDKARSGRK